MARLSILIPCLSDCGLLEKTLLSVLSALSARQDDTEVIVVDRTDYSDPYSLNGDEIRLVRAATRASLCDLVQLGLCQATGEVIHFLGCGMEVEADWYRPALSWFDDDRIGSVAPVYWEGETHATSPFSVLGVRLSATLRRQRVRLASSEVKGESHGQGVLGPIWNAAFYRTELLREYEAFDGEYGDELADAEIACALHDEGWTCVVEPRSQLQCAMGCETPHVSAFHRGRFQQRFLFDHSDSPATASRKAILGDLFGGLVNPSRWVSCLGRIQEARRIRRGAVTGPTDVYTSEQTVAFPTEASNSTPSPQRASDRRRAA